MYIYTYTYMYVYICDCLCENRLIGTFSITRKPI